MFIYICVCVCTTTENFPPHVYVGVKRKKKEIMKHLANLNERQTFKCFKIAVVARKLLEFFFSSLSGRNDLMQHKKWRKLQTILYIFS